jgi:hypothetical protein
MDDQPFLSRIHPGKDILTTSPSQSIQRSDVALYDPENQPIVACSQEDWDLATRIMRSGRMARLGKYCRAFQGEVNETVDGEKGNLSESPSDGPQVLRGSNICLYVLRPPSQGEAIYLRRNKYLKDKNSTAKAWHHKQLRVGVQESCPQNNFRRVIASHIPIGEFCNHKINYFPELESKYPLAILLAILNSKLADWYFRLGSTNASVSHYQLYNLPAPVFASDELVASVIGNFTRWIDSNDFDAAFETIADMLVTAPFPSTVRECIVVAVKRIIAIERDRGDIARAQRSSLDSAAQPIQDLLDRIICRMAGLTDNEVTELEMRLLKML